MYAAQTHSVLIVLQGLDTSGKDGTIAHVMSDMNPQGCAVASFKVPTPDEAAHDFLWRIHKQTPPKGMMTIFNRSHYEDVLITRVHKLVPDDVVRTRYGQIKDFEKLLTDENTIVLKFFLHLSKDQQKARLEAREQDPEKAWKLSAADWKERGFWDDYTTAYEDALGATSAPHAPGILSQPTTNGSVTSPSPPPLSRPCAPIKPAGRNRWKLLANSAEPSWPPCEPQKRRKSSDDHDLQSKGGWVRAALGGLSGLLSAVR